MSDFFLCCLPNSSYFSLQTIKKMTTKLLTLFLLVSRTCTVIQGSAETDYDDNENAIIEDIPNLLTSNSTKEIKENEMLELYCQFNSELTPHINVIWQFKSSDSTQNAKMYSVGFTRFYTKRNFTIESLSEGKNGVKLIIPNMKIEDSGDYQCSLSTPEAKMAIQKVIVQNPSAIALNDTNSNPALKYHLYMPLLIITSSLMRFV